MQNMHDNRGINIPALFTDESKDFRIPPEPADGEEVTIRFRTAREDVDSVYLISGRAQVKMKLAARDDCFDYYEAKLLPDISPFLYYFEIDKGNEVRRYNKLGCTEDIKPRFAFRLTPGFTVPDWARNAVFYQIFTDRFCNGNPDNDVLDGEYYYVDGLTERVKDWSCLPAQLDIRRFYGGDLQGVMEKLDYLQELGVDAIYFNPLFVSPSNHKYDIQDYDYIDPHFGIIVKDEGRLLEEGEKDNRKASRYVSRVTEKANLEATNAYFAQLVAEIHRRGMRVILDGVFNHCGSFNKWMDRERIYEGQEGYEPGAYIRKESPYNSFFRFTGDKWPYNNRYEGWWNHETLPKLNYEESPELYSYIMHIGAKWVSPPYNVDGWRLDVAADLGKSISFNHRFWRDFRRSVKAANPEAIILAEHYGDPSSWMEGDQWDTVMNYDAFMEPVTWFLTGMEKHSDEYQESWYGNGEWFFRIMAYNMSKFQHPSLEIAMNELSNHDHSRFLTRTNREPGRLASRGAAAASENIEKGVLREAVIIQMTWPGAPTIYYGDEAGMVGWTDPDNRRSFPWGHEDWEMIEFHKFMVKVHRQYSCFMGGSYKPLAWGIHWIAYGRFDSDVQAVILVNNRREPLTVTLPVWLIGVPLRTRMERVVQSTPGSYNVGSMITEVTDGQMEVCVGPQTASVFVHPVKEENLEKYL